MPNNMATKVEPSNDIIGEDSASVSIKLDTPPPSTSLFSMLRFLTLSEAILASFGLVLAAISGALMPLMTLVFGTLTTSFTDFGRVTYMIAAEGSSPELQAALELAKQEVMRSARTACLWMVGIGLGMFFTTYCYMVIWNYIGEINAKRLREAYLRSVLRQEIAYFDHLGAGEVATRIQTDCHLVQDGTSEKVPQIVQSLASFIAGFAVGLAKNWRLALVLSTSIPVMVGALIPWSIIVDKLNVEALTHQAKAGTLAEEMIGSIRTVKAFASAPTLAKRFSELVEKARLCGWKTALTDSFGLPLIYFVTFNIYACAFFYGGILVSQGRADSGTVLTVFMAIMLAAFALGLVSDQVQAVNKGRSAAAALFATIERVPVIDSASPGGDTPKDLQGEITFEDVAFTYPSRPDVPILKKFNMTFPAGQSVALVGESGSGKSTIVSLVERFYDPARGAVRLDGRDIKGLNVKWLRQQIGLVSQEPTLFQTTVRGNIEHGLIGSQWEAAAESERFDLIKAACIKANAHDFILKLPQGYDTWVGDRGMLLSGGQKQRIAIARAIVSDPRILLLDEATSALDTQSEGVVQEALNRASVGRTTITIAHRLSTIKSADKIVVMRSGEIQEVGTHSELLTQQGVYSRLVAAQAISSDSSETTESSDIAEEKCGSTITLDANEKVETVGPIPLGVNTPENTSSLPEDENASLSRILRRVVRINRDDKWHYLVGTFSAICHGMAYPATAILLAKALEDFQIVDPEAVKDALRRKALFYFITSFCVAIVAAFQMYCFGVAGYNLRARLQVSSIQATAAHDVQWFDLKENSVGALTSNLMNLPQKVQGLFGSTLGTIVHALTTVVGGVIIGLVYAPLLALIGIACLPIIISQGLVRLYVVELKDERTKKIHESSAHLASEAASAVRTIASLTREDDVDRIYSEALEKPLRLSIKTAYTSQALYAASSAVLFWILALIFYVGARWLVDGKYTSAEFFIVIFAVVFAANEASHFFSFVPDASKAKSAASAIFRLSDHKPAIENKTSEHDPSLKRLDAAKVRGQLTIENLSFRYPSRPGVRVLEGLNMDIKPGTFVALVGPSGCGKSTTIQMLERYYDPLQGRVCLDGIDLRELALDSYRSSVALVAQEPTLYSGTIRFNILLGANKPMSEVKEEEIINACCEANIYDFICSLPDGLDTEVGGKGSQLSGGQKQRIAIARALLRNPKILLLDEATSALDSQSEKVVQAALDKAAKGRTTIAIAHRLSTIQKADMIYCFSEGKVAESGTHNELLALKGQYWSLVNMQSLGGL